MDDLVAFLAVRLDEDEAWAQVAKGMADASGKVFAFALQPGAPMMPTPDDPGRMLRDVEADRALLAEYEQARAKHEEFSKSVDRELAGWWAGRVVEADRIIRIRATIYSDHPDYRQEWKPPQS